MMKPKILIGNKTYVNVGYKNSISYSEPKLKYDDNGKKYMKTSLYIPKQLHTSEELPEIQENCGIIGRKIIKYIIKTLRYDDLNITLNKSVLAKECNCNIDNITRALKKLSNANLIQPIYKYVKDRNTIVESDKYAVNFNHIFKGSYENLNNKIICHNKYNNDYSDKELITYFENNPSLKFYEKSN